MAIENVTRPVDATRSQLLCGQPRCEEIATYIVEFEWNGWAGILGACADHHEDLAVLALKSRVDEDMPRD
jgi:hypothetical protein